MNDPFALWGCGSGYTRQFHPSVRIVCGSLALLALLIAPIQRLPVAAVSMAITIIWCLLAGVPRHITGRVAIAGALFFLPFLLLVPWIAVDHASARPLFEKWITAGQIVVRGVCTLFITTATIASLPLVDTMNGLSPLPLPGAVKVLLLQLINQTSLLAAETLRIITVLKMRGAAGRGGMNVFFSFPVIWMGRTFFRAERIASAMAVRGYGADAVSPGQCALTRRDRIALALAFLTVLASIIMRLREWL
jgi:energy-coupling factor transporter transmembrane protein EcfT